MPNIELHGWDFLRPEHMVTVPKTRVDRCGSRYTSSARYLLMREVKRALEAADFASDVVITQFPSECRDLADNPAPYIRICDTNEGRAKEVAYVLSQFLNVDTEIIVLYSFIPAKKS